MASRIEWDRDALDALLEGPSGPVHQAIMQATVRVNAEAKRLAPVDTGRLRSSITMALERDDRGLVGIVGTDVEYARFVELGTGRMAARPFLRPALNAGRREGGS